MKLSVLDQSPVREGGTPVDAVHETIELGRHVDLLGYRRFWPAEHHSSPGVASTAPEILPGALRRLFRLRLLLCAFYRAEQVPRSWTRIAGNSGCRSDSSRSRAASGVFAICAETEPEARRLAVSRDLMRLRRDLK